MKCGIFDATNTTRSRRSAVLKRCSSATPAVTLLFLESMCNDQAILEHNYRMKLSNEDYKGGDAQKALDDFLERVHAYEKVYEPITDEEVAEAEAEAAAVAAAKEEEEERPPHPMRYIQCVDAGKKVVASRLDGESYIGKWVLHLMHSIHLSPRKLSVVLAGESRNDHAGVRGGDSALSEEGLRYANAAAETVVCRMTASQPPPVAMVGSLTRYCQMGDLIRGTCQYVLPTTALNELCFGSLESVRGGRLRDWLPDEHSAREADKLCYRYPGAGGQSYLDLITQMKDVLLSIEASRRDVIVVCDVAVARVLLGYFEGVPLQSIPDIEVSPGITELSRTHSGFTRTHIEVSEGRVSMLGNLRALDFAAKLLHNKKSTANSHDKKSSANL